MSMRRVALQPSRGAVVGQRPTTLSARAAALLADGALDPLTLMRDVCKVDRLQADAAERMAIALLSSHSEFVRLPSGHWALRDIADADVPTQPGRNSAEAVDAGGGLSAVNFAVVDVETTGTRAGRDRITEIAIVQVSGGAIVDVYAQLVNPERLIPPRITALTHITWAMVKDQPRFPQIAHAVTTRLAGHVFTAHNAAFDWRFVSNELALDGTTLSGPRLCTVRLARLLLPRLARRSLDHVARYFGIDIDARHRAGGDAEATARVLLRLLSIAEDEGLDSWPLLDARVAAPRERLRRSAALRRRRALPMPAVDVGGEYA